MKKLTILTFIILFIVDFASGCSCYRLFFCDYIKSDFVITAFQGKVIDTVRYSENNEAIYVEVIQSYKDQVQITDTIKLYGQSNEAGCEIGVVSRFRLGDTLMIAIGNEFNFNFPIVNPDSLSESYWEYYPNLCDFLGLKVENKIIYGNIDQDFREYPLSDFSEKLENCSFIEEEIDLFKSENNIYTIFPNPTPESFAFIKTQNRYDSIDKIRVFGPDGRLIYSRQNLEGSRWNPIKLENLSIGVNIVEISYGEKVKYLKVISLD